MFLLLLLWPFAEIWVFFKVCVLIGVLRAIILSLLGLFIGLALIWRQGFEAVFSIPRLVTLKNGPPPQIFNTICLALAGLLFIIPGFLSDGIALLLLFPPVRSRLRLSLIERMRQAQSFKQGDFRATYPAQHPQADIIEGDYERLNGEDDNDQHL